MKIFLSNRIKKKEFPKGIGENEKSIIIKYSNPSLGVPISAKGLPKATTLIKAYATSDKGHRRLVYLLRNSSGDMVLLFYRSKKDKVGQNITIKNPDFAKELNSHIDAAFDDIINGNYELL